MYLHIGCGLNSIFLFSWKLFGFCTRAIAPGFFPSTTLPCEQHGRHTTTITSHHRTVNPHLLTSSLHRQTFNPLPPRSCQVHTAARRGHIFNTVQMLNTHITHLLYPLGIPTSLTHNHNHLILNCQLLNLHMLSTTNSSTLRSNLTSSLPGANPTAPALKRTQPSTSCNTRSVSGSTPYRSHPRHRRDAVLMTCR
jgi:hypothetical protein